MSSDSLGPGANAANDTPREAALASHERAEIPIVINRVSPEQIHDLLAEGQQLARTLRKELEPLVEITARELFFVVRAPSR